MSLDLLSGRVGRDHVWYARLLKAGVSEVDLQLFLEGEGKPDIVGVNHYPTSERFLDERLRLYPSAHHGDNGQRRYADVEALRVALPPGDIGPKARLVEVFDRYGIAVAVTEVHHGCSRDEQLRWLAEVWNAAVALRQEGRDLVAVTIWSLFGAVDWNSLLTRRTGFYEPGAFDIRAPAPRITALGRAAASLATTSRYTHPVLDGPGWWHRRERFYHEPRPKPAPHGLMRPLVLSHRSGVLAEAVARICDERGLTIVAIAGESLRVNGYEATRSVPR